MDRYLDTLLFEFPVDPVVVSNDPSALRAALLGRFSDHYGRRRAFLVNLGIYSVFKFEGGKDSPGPVTFSHEEHKERVGGCTACHVKIFKMKKGADAPFTMESVITLCCGAPAA